MKLIIDNIVTCLKSKKNIKSQLRKNGYSEVLKPKNKLILNQIIKKVK